MEMIERVAHMLAKRNNSQHPEAFYGIARAVIEEMREPTEAMLNAVAPEPVHLYEGRDEEYKAAMKVATVCDQMGFKSGWTLAIDAALKEHEGR